MTLLVKKNLFEFVNDISNEKIIDSVIVYYNVNKIHEDYLDDDKLLNMRF